MRLVDYAWRESSEESPYQRVKAAKETFLKQIACVATATPAAARWFDALDTLNAICHAWWPPGDFRSTASGIPSQSDVERLRRMLMDFVAETTAVLHVSPLQRQAPTEVPTPCVDALMEAAQPKRLKPACKAQTQTEQLADEGYDDAAKRQPNVLTAADSTAAAEPDAFEASEPPVFAEEPAAETPEVLGYFDSMHGSNIPVYAPPLSKMSQAPVYAVHHDADAFAEELDIADPLGKTARRTPRVDDAFFEQCIAPYDAQCKKCAQLENRCMKPRRRPSIKSSRPG